MHDNYMLLKIAVTRRTRAQNYEHKIWFIIELYAYMCLGFITIGRLYDYTSIILYYDFSRFDNMYYV